MDFFTAKVFKHDVRYWYLQGTEDCKLVVTCKMQNRNATDKLNQQCSKLALFNILPQISVIVLANNGFSLSVAFLFCILEVTTNLQSSVGTHCSKTKHTSERVVNTADIG